ncbi:MAG: hypothetical protein FWE85_04805, partial [Clostridiales bacterium]|nr:hypothetical protein [Clostridiales bacterium]
MTIKKSTKVMLSKILTVLVIVGFMFANTTLPVAAITAYQEARVQKSLQTDLQTDNGISPYDEKAFELLLRLSEYNSFTDEEKLYIREYLGISMGATQAEKAEPAARAELPLYDEAIRIMLEKGSFTLCDGEEKAKVLEFLGCLSETEIEALTKDGLSLTDIFHVNLVLREGFFSVEEAVVIIALYPDVEERNKQLFIFRYLMKDQEESDLWAAVDLFVGGKSVFEVKQILDLKIKDERQSSPSSPLRQGLSDSIAPFYIWNGANENVDLNNGGLGYMHNVLSLPGVSGFGVNLTLVYNTSKARLDKPSYHQLGAGWNWNLPYIEHITSNNSTTSTLHLGDGRSYEIGAPNSNIYTLKNSDQTNYSLQDMVLKKHTTYSNGNGQPTSEYVLEYKNGDKVYFSSSGLLIAQRDRYDNTIQYIYDPLKKFNGKDVINQIIDTGSRDIYLTYANTSSPNGWTVTVKAPDNSQAVISMTQISGH